MPAARQLKRFSREMKEVLLSVAGIPTEVF
jgi:hypothetical protein